MTKKQIESLSETLDNCRDLISCWKAINTRLDSTKELSSSLVPTVIEIPYYGDDLSFEITANKQVMDSIIKQLEDELSNIENNIKDLIKWNLQA